MQRNNVLKTLDTIIGKDLLIRAAKKDQLANGVQFLGSEIVTKIALGVSLNLEFLDKAVASGAQMCIFHHGFDTRAPQSIYSLSSQKRLRTIIKNDLTIIGYHYALDAHSTIGNNAQMVTQLGAELDEPLYEDWGWIGQFKEPRHIHEIAQHCESLFGHSAFAVYSGPEMITRFGAVSGGAKPYAEHIAEMETKDVQLFITGEPSESVPHRMKESEINYLACGHYATETLGVKALGVELQKHLPDLEVEFIDVWNNV